MASVQPSKSGGLNTTLIQVFSMCILLLNQDIKSRWQCKTTMGLNTILKSLLKIHFVTE